MRFLVIFLALANAAFGQQQPQQFGAEIDILAGLRSVSVAAEISATETPCRISQDDLRAAIVNRVAPAGLSVTSNSPYTILTEIIIINPAGICVASLQTGLFVPNFAVSLNDKSLWAPATMHRHSRLMSRAMPEFREAVISRVVGDVDIILSRWREANPGAEFIRQAPAANLGPNIGTVQRRLATLGLYQGAVDSNFGPATRRAVQEFQRANQLPATGDLDPETLRRLFP